MIGAQLRADQPRYPVGRVALKCERCRLVRPKVRVQPCEQCGGEMTPVIVYNAPLERSAA